MLAASISALCACAVIGARAQHADQQATSPVLPQNVVGKLKPVDFDSIIPQADAEMRYRSLTDDDFRKVAEELQIEPATMKAVVSIEAGREMNGFWAPGIPIVNYDRSMWAKCKRLVTNTKKAPASTKIPAGLTNANARRAWQKLIAARKICEQQANLSTFWGMFQIGGFNYKACGCKTIEEFVSLMSYSELEQLELFAAFITNTKMVTYLRSKNWAAFASRYNGPSYARRGYHTKLAAAYAKYKEQFNASQKNTPAAKTPAAAAKNPAATKPAAAKPAAKTK